MVNKPISGGGTLGGGWLTSHKQFFHDVYQATKKNNGEWKTGDLAPAQNPHVATFLSDPLSTGKMVKIHFPHHDMHSPVNTNKTTFENDIVMTYVWG